MKEKKMRAMLLMVLFASVSAAGEVKMNSAGVVKMNVGDTVNLTAKHAGAGYVPKAKIVYGEVDVSAFKEVGEEISGGSVQQARATTTQSGTVVIDLVETRGDEKEETRYVLIVEEE